MRYVRKRPAHGRADMREVVLSWRPDLRRKRGRCGRRRGSQAGRDGARAGISRGQIRFGKGCGRYRPEDKGLIPPREVELGKELKLSDKIQQLGKSLTEGNFGDVMVVGGGVSGIQASLDLANAGFKVYLVEKGPALGGHMAQLDKTFPTNDCSMCTLSPRLVEVGRHKDVDVITGADVTRIEGGVGNFKVTLRKRPRYVDEDRCT